MSLKVDAAQPNRLTRVAIRAGGPSDRIDEPLRIRDRVIDRRRFISGIASVFVAAPLATEAQEVGECGGSDSLGSLPLLLPPLTIPMSLLPRADQGIE